MSGFESVQTGSVIGPPQNVPAGCPIPWQPNAFAPVFYGYRDYLVHLPAGVRPAVTDHPCRVFYPSVAVGPPEEVLILRGCGRFPLIVFAHGDCDLDLQHEYLQWYEHPAHLARCGYVVLVPQLPSIAGFDPDDPGDQQLILRLIDWMHTGWEYANTLLPAPATGIVGHSNGGGVAVQLAAAHPETFAAVATLSAQQDRVILLTNSPLPKLHTWGSRGSDFVPIFPEQWEKLPPPKHMVLFAEAHHFDYQDAERSVCGANLRGDCPLVPALTRELLMMFFGRYLQPESAPDLRLQINPHLIPPTLADLRASLSEEQQFYTNPDNLVPFLEGFEQLETTASCSLTLQAEVGTIPVPDLFELSATEAASEIAQLGLVPDITGSTNTDAWVDSQTPLAGNLAEPGTTVTINMRTGHKF